METSKKCLCPSRIRLVVCCFFPSVLHKYIFLSSSTNKKKIIRYSTHVFFIQFPFCSSSFFPVFIYRFSNVVCIVFVCKECLCFINISVSCTHYTFANMHTQTDEGKNIHPSVKNKMKRNKNIENFWYVYGRERVLKVFIYM